MYDQNQGKLELVKSESELKPGMAVVLKDCLDCNTKHTFILNSFDKFNINTCDCHGRWTSFPPPCSNNYWIFHHSIKGGRLFKIVDENPISDIIEEIEAIKKLEEKLINFKELIK